MVKVRAVDVGDEPAVQASIAERSERSRAKLARYEKLRARFLDGRSEEEYLAHAERIGPYLTLLGGIAFEQANIRWAELALAVLQQRASAGAHP
jgi:hypothetical protein